MTVNRNRLFTAPRASLEGYLLIAAPRQTDTHFARSVVYVVQDDENGTFGVELNRTVDDESWSDFRDQSGAQELERHFAVQGGPLDGPVFALHQSQSLAEIEIPGGIYVSSDSEALRELMEQIEAPYRIVLGIAGWRSKEIRREILQGLWWPMRARPQDVFETSELMWENCVRRYGREKLSSVLGIEIENRDPHRN